MRVKKSEIKTGILQKVLQRKPKPEPVSPAIDRTDEILDAVKKIDVQHVELKMPDEIVRQQKNLLNKIEELCKEKEYPVYNFEIQRSSDGFIKKVQAVPEKSNKLEQKNIAESWYKNG